MEERPDGAVRPTLPWQHINNDEQKTAPLHSILKDWISTSPQTSDGLPLVSTLFGGQFTDTSQKMLFVKIYWPREGRIAYVP